MRHRLTPGDPAPWFSAPALAGNPAHNFSTAAGRHLLVLAYGSAVSDAVRDALGLVARADLFDDRQAAFFGISTDPEDVRQARIAPRLPGIRHLLDHDGAVSRRLGALPPDSEGSSPERHDPHWLLLDPALQVLGAYSLDQGARVLADLALAIELHRREGGSESGFMREVDGKTVVVSDPAHKRRTDVTIADASLLATLRARIARRLVPLVQRAFQFDASRVERYIVACYDAESGGYFRQHRDNTTRGTAHRRFAVTINLNAEDHEGGELRFPEFGPRRYRATTGGAVVFSCSLQHEALPVTAGRRYAFLPFLYDEAGARIRAANNEHLGEGIGAYRPR